jgi:hypothetical protein
MKSTLYKKGMVLGVITLFIVACFLPCGVGKNYKNNNFELEVITNPTDGVTSLCKSPLLQGGQEKAIYYYNEVNYAALGIKNATNITWIAAIRITPSELVGYEGWDLVAARFYHYVVNNTNPTHYGRVKIFDDDTATSPGPLLASKAFNVTGTGWIRINLSTPVPLDIEKDIWVGIEITSSSGEKPVALDRGPAVDKKGDWLYHESFGWVELQNTPAELNYNFNIEAIIYGSPPDPPDKPSGPTLLQTGETGSYSTSTTDPDGHKIYYWFDWGDNTNSGWQGPYESGETCTLSHKWDRPHTYQIKVQAKDERNTLSNWSAPLTISVVNTPPDTPGKPSGPTKVRRKREVNFTTNTTDFNGDPVYFMWDWGDGNVTKWLGPYNPGEDCVQSHSWEKRGDYKIRVKAKDTYGDESDWSEPLEIKVRLFKGLNAILLSFLERHPRIFPILRFLLELQNRIRGSRFT